MTALIAPIEDDRRSAGGSSDPSGANKMTKQGLSESAVRRRAAREGYGLRKSRSRSEWPMLEDHGEYMLVDVSTNISVIGHKFDAWLSDIAKFLRDGHELLQHGYAAALQMRAIMPDKRRSA